MILDRLTTRELMSSTASCTTAMIYEYHVIKSEREGRKAVREKPSRHSKNTWSRIASVSVGRLHGLLTHLELRKCLDSRSRENMTSEGRTAGVLCLVNVSEPCLECRIHVDTVLEPQSPGTATLENRGRWHSIWQPPLDIPFLVMFWFTYSLLDHIHAWPGTYYLDLSIFIFPVLYIRTTRTHM